MALQDSREAVDLEALQEHLSEAMDSAEDERTKYHLREVYQKAVILEEET
jgi:hypothetical protein